MSLTPLKPLLVSVLSNKPSMRALLKESAVSRVFIVNVVFQRQPFCYHRITITVWGGHHAPVYVVDHALLPLAN